MVENVTSITESQRQMLEDKNREALENLQAANENLLMENYDLKSKVETLETNASVERLKFLEIIKEQNLDQNNESEDLLKNLTRIYGHEIISKQEKLQRRGRRTPGDVSRLRSLVSGYTWLRKSVTQPGSRLRLVT